MRLISRNNIKGFTLVELILALTVLVIIYTAIATLASAMSDADSATKDMSEQQAKVRFATVYISELIRNGNHIIELSTPITGFCVWTDSDMDGKPTGGELAYIKTGTSAAASSSGKIELIEFPGETQEFTIAEISAGTAYTWCSNYSSQKNESTLLSDCSNITLNIDSDAKSVGLNFDVLENGATQSYEIFAAKRCSADHALDYTGEIDVSGDDDI